MALKTPAIGMAGIFILRDPFTIPATKYYTVEGHRTFSEMISSGEDPVETIYIANGLTEADYNTDATTPGILVVILVSTDGERVVVPNTYIEDYPNTAIVPHSWVVATISMGMLPADYDLTRVSEAIKTSVSDFIGVEPNVYFAKKNTSDAVTEEVAEQLAAIRNAAITNRTTDYAEKLALQQRITVLENEISDLIDIIGS